MNKGWASRLTRWILHRLMVLVGALALTLVLFLVLPILESINSGPKTDMIIQTVDTANVPPPPPPPEEEEKKEEPEPEKEPPKLNEESPPLDLSQLELALNPGGGGSDGLLPDMANKLSAGGNEGGDVDSLFSLADLDQKPRVMFQPSPLLDPKLRKSGPATVYILFIVDQNGRVQDARIQNSSNPMFDSVALAAVKKWKFEPGKRNGEAVRFRMRVPISFPKE